MGWEENTKIKSGVIVKNSIFFSSILQYTPPVIYKNLNYCNPATVTDGFLTVLLLFTERGGAIMNGRGLCVNCLDESLLFQDSETFLYCRLVSRQDIPVLVTVDLFT